jgi:hypothetical protein
MVPGLPLGQERQRFMLNCVFERMLVGQMEGRVVLDLDK